MFKIQASSAAFPCVLFPHPLNSSSQVTDTQDVNFTKSPITLISYRVLTRDLIAVKPNAVSLPYWTTFGPSQQSFSSGNILLISVMTRS